MDNEQLKELLVGALRGEFYLGDVTDLTRRRGLVGVLNLEITHIASGRRFNVRLFEERSKWK